MKARLTLTCCMITSLALAGCGGAIPAKDGGAARTLTLSAVSYTPNALAGETLDRFVTDIDDATSGAVKLELGPALDAGAQDGSADVIDMVRDGRVDIGVVASRTFDLEGATSLQALNAPLAVESPAQAARLLSDPVVAPMLAGLDPAGIVGLALTYDQMRQPLGFKGPLTPENLKGQRVLVRPSKASSMVMAALGAVADPRNGDDAASAINGGEVTGSESSVDRGSGSLTGSAGQHSTFTANVQLSIKANVIIVNPNVWAGLTDDQQDSFRAAAAATATWASHQVVSLADAASAFCDQHLGDVVVANAHALGAWKRAVEPVVSELAAADPATAAALNRMRELVREFPSIDVPRPCTMVSPDDLPRVEPDGDQSVMAGEWRLLVSADKFAAAGASAQDIGLNQGTWTFTFSADGSYTYVEPHGRSCPGTFAVAGDRLSLQEDLSVGDCDGHWEFTFTRDADQMTWTPTPEFEATDPPVKGFFANPLELIAGP